MLLVPIRPQPHPATAGRRKLKSLSRPHPAQPRAPSCPRYPLQNPLDLCNSTSSIATCEFLPPHVTPILPLLGPCLPLPLPTPSPWCEKRRSQGSGTGHTQLPKPRGWLRAGERDWSNPAPKAQGMLGAAERDWSNPAPKAQGMLGAGELPSQHLLLLHAPTSRGWGGRSTLCPSRYTDLPLHYPRPGTASRRL